MERRYPNLTPVRHKRDKYTGWIDGITKIDGLFTGNVDVPWQYRVYMADGTRRVAPEEDLEHDRDASGLPPKELRERYVDSMEGESELHAIGYNLSDLNSEERRRLLVFCAFPMLGPEVIVRNLCDILWRKVRRKKEEKIERYHNAIEQWAHDLDFVLGHEQVALKKFPPDLLNYVIAVKEHLEDYVKIKSDIPLARIKKIQGAKKKSG